MARRRKSENDLLCELRSILRYEKDASYTNMSIKYPKLTENLRNRVGRGSWYKALEKAGVPSNRFRRQHAPRTQDELIVWMKAREKEGVRLSSANIKENHPAMYSAIQKKFPGGFYAGLRAAGIEPSKYWKYQPDTAKRQQARRPGTWTPDLTLQTLRERHRQRKEMSEKAIREDNYPLYKACYRNFSGVYPAIQKIGVDPDEWRLAQSKGYWSENPHNRVIERVKSLAAREGMKALSARAAYVAHGDLYDAALKYFPGGWEEAVSQAGFDYKSIRKQREPYTKAELIENLRSLQAGGHSLAWSNVRNYDGNLAAAIVSRFGKYEYVFRELKLDYNAIRKDWGTEARKGGLFEKYLLEVFDVIGRRVQYQRRFRYESETCVPDFYEPHTRQWIDAKLDPTTPETSLSIEKYLRHTDSVEIVYLKDGHLPRVKDRMSGRVKFVPVREFYPRLTELGKDDLILRFEQLRRARLKREDIVRNDEQQLDSLKGKHGFLPLTETRILAWLEELQAEGQKIDPGHLPVKLRRAAVQVFGGTWEMYEAAGIDTTAFFKRQKYTRKRLISIMRGRYIRGESITHDALRKEYPGICIAIGRIFRRTENLYKEAKIPLTQYVTAKPLGYWNSKENVKKELLDRHRQGLDMKRIAVQRDNSTLEAATYRLFGGFYQALKAAGIDPAPYQTEAPKGFWRDDEILRQIEALATRGEDLSDAAVRKNHGPLYNAAKRRFRGWYAALTAAEVNPDQFRRQAPYSSRNRDSTKTV